MKIRKTLTTNGLHLDEEKADWLKNNGYYVGFSMDGDRKTQDRHRYYEGRRSCFQDTLNALQRYLDSGLNGRVIMVVRPDTAAFVSDNLKFLHSRGVRAFSINLDYTAKWKNRHLRTLKNQYRKVLEFFIRENAEGRRLYISSLNGKINVIHNKGYRSCDKCGFGIQEMSVAPSGNIYPCERIVGNDDNEELRMGTVFSGINPAKTAAVKEMKKKVKAECVVCRYRPFCVHWCGCVNFQSTGSPAEVSGLQCRHEQIMIDMAMAVYENAGLPVSSLVPDPEKHPRL